MLTRMVMVEGASIHLEKQETKACLVNTGAQCGEVLFAENANGDTVITTGDAVGNFLRYTFTE